MTELRILTDSERDSLRERMWDEFRNRNADNGYHYYAWDAPNGMWSDGEPVLDSEIDPVRAACCECSGVCRGHSETDDASHRFCKDCDPEGEETCRQSI